MNLIIIIASHESSVLIVEIWNAVIYTVVIPNVLFFIGFHPPL